MSSPIGSISRRRVVTEIVDGKSTIKSDEVVQPYVFAAHPAYEQNLLWASPSIPDLAEPPSGELRPSAIVPHPGGSIIMFATMPPEALAVQPTFDSEALAAEYASQNPGIAQYFDPSVPGMHATPTIDYAIVWSGEAWLELGDGSTVHLQQGDVVIQNGTAHRWSNRGTASTVMLFIMHGAHAAGRVGRPSDS